MKFYPRDMYFQVILLNHVTDPLYKDLVFYLPHHIVVDEIKLITKVQVVFDGSAFNPEKKFLQLGSKKLYLLLIHANCIHSK